MGEQKKPENSSVLKELWGKVKGTAKKTAEATKQGLQVLATKKEEREWNARLKKYNPLFPEQYTAADFYLPNVVRIVDDAERRDIDVCKGAIGWRSKEEGIEVLHLYDEAVSFSGLKFLPIPLCNNVYIVHPYNRNAFISVEEYAEVIQQEKMAELQEIAFSLGAKRYWVEMVEEDESGSYVGVSADGNTIKEHKVGVSVKNKKEKGSKGEVYLVCKGKGKPYVPTLCWFKEDKNVEYLIKQRCSKQGKKMRVHNLLLSSGTVALHSTTVGVAMKFKEKSNKNLGAKVGGEKTNNKSMLVRLEF